MSKLRSVSTAFWSDPFIEDLTPSEKLLYLYFITNEKTNMLGIYELSIKKISFETGLTKDIVSKALESFERIGKIKYKENYLILLNFLKHQHFNTNMIKSAIDCYENLPNFLKDNSIKLDKNNTLESFETLSNHFGMVPKVEVEVEVEKEVEKEVEVEKINPLRLYVSQNFPNVSKLKTQLSNKECIELLNKFGNTLIDQKLKAMENSAQLTKKNLSVYLTLTNWCNKDKISQLPTQPLQNVSPPSQYKRHEL
jgi:NADH/NAD ratio-sensing transcriptional regulator Rex